MAAVCALDVVEWVVTTVCVSGSEAGAVAALFGGYNVNPVDYSSARFIQSTFFNNTALCASTL